MRLTFAVIGGHINPCEYLKTERSLQADLTSFYLSVGKTKAGVSGE